VIERSAVDAAAAVETEAPRVALPVGLYLLGGAGAAMGVGVVSAGVGYGAGVYDGVSALLGGVAAAGALAVTALGILPWRRRVMKTWMPLLFGAQLATLALGVLLVMVLRRATGAELGPMGLTAAVGFMAGQGGQARVFWSVVRPVERAWLARRREAEQRGQDGLEQADAESVEAGAERASTDRV
jgi:hypothetical protein